MYIHAYNILYVRASSLSNVISIPIPPDIDNLYERRRQLVASFRSKQADYQEERMRIRQEEERKREEARQAHKEAKFKRKL